MTRHALILCLILSAACWHSHADATGYHVERLTGDHERLRLSAWHASCGDVGRH